MRERNSKIENIMPALVQAKQNAKHAWREDQLPEMNRAQRRALLAVKRGHK
jgi:hypothetical protein